MKKKIVIGSFFVILLVIVVVVSIKSNKNYPDGIYFARQSNWGDSDGLYFFKNNFLNYYERSSEKIVPVCGKPNCNHVDNTCDANAGSGGSIIKYDEHLYFSYFTIDNIVEDGELKVKIQVFFVETKLDGSNRKILYEANNGMVDDMVIVKGKLYYSLHTEQKPGENNYYAYNNEIYCYDLTWGTTKKIFSLEGDEKRRYNTHLGFVEGDNQNRIIVTYKYENVEESAIKVDIMELNVESNKVDMVKEGLENELIMFDINLLDLDGDLYVLGCDAEDVFYFGKLNKDNSVENILVSQNASKIMSGDYIQFVINDEDRMLYDIETKDFYISKHISNGEEGNIPDLYLGLKESNICYYDYTDYSGINPGDVFTEDPRTYETMSWKEYLEMYYVPYEGQTSDLFTFYLD